MARRQHEGQYKTQDGTVTVVMQAMGGVTAGKLGLKLGKLFGPSLGTLIMSAHNKDAAGMASAVKELFGNLSEQQFTELLSSVLAEAQVNTGEEFKDATVKNLDSIFEGCPGSIYKILFDGLALNFTSFSSELGIPQDLLPKLQELAKKAADKAMKSAGA